MEAAQVQAQRLQVVSKAQCGVHAVGAGGLHALAGDDGAVEIGAAGDDDGLGVIDGAQPGADAGNPAVLGENFHDLGLLELEVFLLFQGQLHDLLVLAAVGLGPEGMDGGTLAPVEHAVLDAGPVGGHAHLAAQGVQLPDQMALAGAADGGIAGQIAHGVQIDGENDRIEAQTGGSQCGLNARMTRTDDGHIAASCVISHNDCSL